jgi:hypothetical protein
VSVF